MEPLSSKTVFHDIDLKVNDEDDFRGESIIPDAEWQSAGDSDGDDGQPPTEDGKPPVNSDDEWDTDLEDDGTLLQRRYIIDDQAKKVYLAACRQLHLVPAHCFLKAINTTSINLNFQGLGPIGTRAVATGLVMDRTCTQLYLAGNFIGRDGIRYVCEMLRENEYLTHVDLSENSLETYAAELIADVFKENDIIVSLNLSGNQFKDQDAEHFAAILSVGSYFRNGQYTGLRRLNLSHNKFGDEGATVLGKAIGDNETLVELDLSWNQIRRDGIHNIGKGLGENNSLRHLDLSCNGVDDIGADCLGKALVTNRYLHHLNLASNRIGIEGVKTLFTNLAKNETLKVLKLSSNPISLEGPLVALALIKQSEVCVLEELDISDACVPREFYSILEEVQETRPTFKVLIGGYMNARDMCKAVAKTTQEKWMKDPVLVFINFVEERKLKIFDMFKQFDKDKSCTLTREEFIGGLLKIGCPLEPGQYTELLNTLDVDRNGEIDLAEFMDGYAIHKRRFAKYQRNGSGVSSALNKSRPPSSQSSSRPGSKASSRLGSGLQRPKVNCDSGAKEVFDETSSSQSPDSNYLNVPREATLDTGLPSSSQASTQADIVLSVPKGVTVA